ncbi:hypothetical protein cypCar_00049330, partial [Cyprinus carpio]
NALEGYDKPDGELDSSVSNLHNLVHLFLNGTSALSHSAANDPIFLCLEKATFKETDSRPVMFLLGSTLGGIFLGLLLLLLLSVLYVQQRKRREFEPLLNTEFTTTKYTEDA